MIRRRKKWTKPRKLFDVSRIEEESRLMKKYGLKNKREIWKAKFFVERLRKRAKDLLFADDKEKISFLNKLKEKGLFVKNIDDVLSLKVEDILERRLQTIVFRKGFASTPKHARQLIVHRHIFVGDRIINKPSFIVSKKLEDKIKKV